MAQLLEGVRVLDLSRYIAGPYCALMLADMGAEVIKVEKEGLGDETRQLGPWKDGVSLYFPAYNRNKQSVSIDFRSAEGQKSLRELIKDADVVVENFRPGTLEKMGLSFEEMQKINPKIILTSVSGFGQVGPYSERAAFDVVISAMGGLYKTFPDKPPVKAGAGQPIADTMAALYGTIGTLAALYYRQNTGIGQHVDASMYSSLAQMLTTPIADYALNGSLPELDVPDCAPQGTIKAKDGYVNIHAGTDPMFRRVKTFIDDPVLHDPKYEDIPTRVKDRELLLKTVEKWASDKTCKEVEKAFVDAGIPVGVVNTPQTIYEDEHLNATGYFVDVEVPGIGKVPYPGCPIRFSATPITEYRKSPLLGEDNDKYLHQEKEEES